EPRTLNARGAPLPFKVQGSRFAVQGCPKILRSASRSFKIALQRRPASAFLCTEEQFAQSPTGLRGEMQTLSLAWRRLTQDGRQIHDAKPSESETTCGIVVKARGRIQLQARARRPSRQPARVRLQGGARPVRRSPE